MATLVLLTSDDPDALLRAAASPFCTQGRAQEPLPLLAVRQGSIRDAVYEMAAASGTAGWFGNPIVVFEELADLFTRNRAPLYDLERQALLARILTERRTTALGANKARRTVIDALDRLFGDLVANDVSAAMLRDRLATLDGDAWAASRNADVASVYEAYLAQLSTLPADAGLARSDGRDGLLAAARAITAAGPEEIAGLRRPFGRTHAPRSIDVYGLADLRRGWRLFLDALHASPAVDELRVYSLDQPDGASHSEVRRWAIANGAIERRVPASRHFAGTIASIRRDVLSDAGTRSTPVGELTLTAAPDVTRELEQVARTIKQMLVDGDERGACVAAGEIAVVSRQARPYLTRAADIFAQYGIPTHARLRHTLTDVPAIAAFLRLLRAAAGGWTNRALQQLSDSPYFALDLDLALVRELTRGVAGSTRPRGLAGLRQALDADIAVAGDADAEQVARRRARLAEARTRIGAFITDVGKLDGTHLTTQWIELTIEALGGVGARTHGMLDFYARVNRPLASAAPRVLQDAARIDSAAVGAAVDLLVAWRDAVSLAPPTTPYFIGDWLTELEHALGEREVSARTGDRGGVRLIEATGSEGQSWDHLFVVGMSTGSFPAEPGRDVLFGDAERRRLFDDGLPIEPSAVWLEREMALFRGLMKAPSSSLHLSYAYADTTGAPQLPAAYLDDVVSRVDPQSSWLTRIPGSRVAPDVADRIWSNDEALRVAAQGLRHADTEAHARALLAAVAANDTHAARVAQLLHAAAVERTRADTRALPDGTPRPERAHAWNGRIDSPELRAALEARFGDRVWSATQLESYGRCGFTFFGKYVLGATELEDVDDDELSARDSGSIMHHVLARTYERMLEYDPVDPLTGEHRARAASIVAEEVEQAFLLFGVRGPEGLLTARRHETTLVLQQYVQWEIAQNDKAKDRTRPLHMELSFGMDDASLPPAVLEHEGRRLRLRGQIDRVDELIPEVAQGYRYIVDHKSGGSALKPVGVLQDAGAILQLALYIAALEQVLPGSGAWGGAYQLIREQKQTASLNRCSIGPKGQLREATLVTEKKSDDTIRNAARLALSLVDGVLAGRFAARVPDNTNCLNYCQFRHACREERVATW